MNHLEQGVADLFNRRMCDNLRLRGVGFHAFSLGGQDRDAADYLVSDSACFSLIEFKYTEAQFRDERNKPRREKLCTLLAANPRMRALHDQCHFIAWMDSGSQQLRCAPYRSQVCNQKVFSSCSAEAPDRSAAVSLDTYCNQFISPPPPRTAEKEPFVEYLHWLMTVASDSGRSTVSVLALEPDSCVAVELGSVEKAYDWMQKLSRPSGPRMF